MKILILGHNGMLGHMLVKYLSQSFTIETIQHKWPEADFKETVQKSNAEIVVNCIGAIPQKTEIYDVNFELPIWLEENFKGRIIHPGTDCEIDNDPYGNSKTKASNFIIEKGRKTKILKVSLIGPELSSHSSLLDWFLLNNDKVISGYKDAMWSGVTTLTWAKECMKLIENWDRYEIQTILESTCISKYDLLSLFKEVFKKEIEIKAIPDKGTNKCLKGSQIPQNIKQQLEELKKFYYDTRS
tara:strand:+ start:3370 stop:4095 length:726 start_codon:yes stop_codon:yes gene_type:complete